MKLVYLVIGAIVLAVVSLYAITEQNRTTEISTALYEHPFMVTNADKNIKDDVKTIHSVVDDAIAHGGDLDEAVAKISVLETSIQKNVQIVKKL